MTNGEDTEGSAAEAQKLLSKRFDFEVASPQLKEIIDGLIKNSPGLAQLLVVPRPPTDQPAR